MNSERRTYRNSNEAIRHHLPYLAKRMDDALGGWILLNRRYKPIGHPAVECACYESIPRHLRIGRITTAAQRRLSGGSGSRLNEMIFLYEDATFPLGSKAAWANYQERLMILAGMKCLND